MKRADVAWLIHIGDIFGSGCTNEAYENRFRQLNEVDYPVIYTPGDNEWTDCLEHPGDDPLMYLATIRRTFFAHPQQSLGRRTIALQSQASDSAFSVFVENVRWTYGRFVFATVHLVGSRNGLQPFPGRTSAHDAEVQARTRAAVAWLDGAFAQAERDSAKGVVIATHANLWNNQTQQRLEPYFDFTKRLEHHAATFPGPVLLIHGDSHIQRVDHPLENSSGSAYANFTRLETFGSPDIGWTRVVIDTLAGRVAQYEPRLMRGWW